RSRSEPRLHAGAAGALRQRSGRENVGSYEIPLRARACSRARRVPERGRNRQAGYVVSAPKRKCHWRKKERQVWSSLILVNAPIQTLDCQWPPASDSARISVRRKEVWQV